MTLVCFLFNFHFLFIFSSFSLRFLLFFVFSYFLNELGVVIDWEKGPRHIEYTTIDSKNIILFAAQDSVGEAIEPYLRFLDTKTGKFVRDDILLEHATDPDNLLIVNLEN